MELIYTDYPGVIESATITLSDTQLIRLSMHSVDVNDVDASKKSLSLSIITNEFGTDSEITTDIGFDDAKDIYVMIHKFLQQMK